MSARSRQMGLPLLAQGEVHPTTRIYFQAASVVQHDNLRLSGIPAHTLSMKVPVQEVDNQSRQDSCVLYPHCLDG